MERFKLFHIVIDEVKRRSRHDLVIACRPKGKRRNARFGTQFRSTAQYSSMELAPNMIQKSDREKIYVFLTMSCNFLIESHSAIAPLTIMCGFYHQPLMMALEYTAVLMCLFNSSPISAVVPQWLQLLVGGWVCTVLRGAVHTFSCSSCIWCLVVGCYTVEWTNRLMVIFK